MEITHKTEAGPFYRRSRSEAGRLDMVFARKDRVTTVCAIKYRLNPPGSEIMKPLEKAIAILPANRQRSIQTVLLSPNGALPSPTTGYFDEIIDWP